MFTCLFSVCSRQITDLCVCTHECVLLDIQRNHVPVQIHESLHVCSVPVRDQSNNPTYQKHIHMIAHTQRFLSINATKHTHTHIYTYTCAYTHTQRFCAVNATDTGEIIPMFPLQVCNDPQVCTKANATCTVISDVYVPSTYLSFTSGPRGLVTVLVVMFGDGWFDLLLASMDSYGDWAIMIFVFAYWLGGLFLCNMPVAIFCCVFLDRIQDSTELENSAHVQPDKNNNRKTLVHAVVNSEDAVVQKALWKHVKKEDLSIRRLAASVGSLRQKLQHNCSDNSVHHNHNDGLYNKDDVVRSANTRPNEVSMSRTTSSTSTSTSGRGENMTWRKRMDACRPYMVALVNAARKIITVPGKTQILDVNGLEPKRYGSDAYGYVSVDVACVNGLEHELAVDAHVNVHVRLVRMDDLVHDGEPRHTATHQGSAGDRQDNGQTDTQQASCAWCLSALRMLRSMKTRLQDLLVVKHDRWQWMQSGFATINQHFVREITTPNDSWELQVRACIHMYMCMRVYICVCVCVCVYTYIHNREE
jgi:hypothetical protein